METFYKYDNIMISTISESVEHGSVGFMLIIFVWLLAIWIGLWKDFQKSRQDESLNLVTERYFKTALFVGYTYRFSN